MFKMADLDKVNDDENNTYNLSVLANLLCIHATESDKLEYMAILDYMP